ncbi:8-amino-7-oxononanoate synthase [Gilvimarinus agarilyticus]|uniref:8-amino-7-oxononanoate synthase n=1 Tax=unclassified Gilvimarinus TaxID=2642066 RepID=UPI001C083811|nr:MULTISPECIES: 8-amino-7-oxononanoate synthase [unclassified Gilvimarinus]MBU2885336.1 8-amino-7-oxononanoate synthase [Gilvimarinus agarilyticus]MDO6570235.1 8-amino-7-oxononanoate synthase [Gilvimarinus sp. 2_MG-2023]MDO6748230.1 8-amino-7-oxononanoate synthase [Gilvimarinus sp. 1_MG-2023]
MNPFEQHLAAVLDERRALSRYRVRPHIESPQGPDLVVDGKVYTAFCSNDYLGLANHPDVVSAMAQSVGQWGVGSGASHLVCGHSAEHHALEQELAAFCGRERALVFSTGFMANLGAVTALVGRGDHILQDKLNHASLLDAGLLSGARFSRFLHSDLNSLRARLAKADTGRTLVAVDGVFSMDGDIAPLQEQAALVREHNAWLMVDDAHGFGCLGQGGRGTTELLGLDAQDVPVLMGTLGKALGTFGAFIAGSDTLIEALIQLARPYIYTTALPPAVAAASRRSLQLVTDEPWRRQRLAELIAQFRAGAQVLGLRLMPSETAIQPIIVGADADALEMSFQLRQRGFWVSAIRPPTVAEGSARLRVTLTASHTHQHVEGLLQALADILSDPSKASS